MAETGTHGLYAAFLAKDARFDGRFFVGIASTGIYCRPVCRARTPKEANCTFYRTAAEAERAGFRPCLLCRPELAPGLSTADATAGLARRAAGLLEASCGRGLSLEALAKQLGCTGRHLRRVFAQAYGVTPVQYVQTCRLLLAKSLLTDTGLSVLEVAMAAGFGSLRRFNALLRQQYRLTPTALRRRAPAGLTAEGGITLYLGYRPPYPWAQVLDFLGMRAIPGVEAVQGGAYLRTVRLVDGGGRVLTGWIRVAHRADRHALAVTLPPGLLPVLAAVLSRVRHLFDLACDPAAVQAVLASMDGLRPGLCVAGTRLPGCFDPFEMAVRAVLGQQITVKAACTLAGRLVRAYGSPVGTGLAGLTHAFPAPEAFLALEGPAGGHLGPLGITGARAGTILSLARAFAAGSVDCGPGAQPEAEMQKLQALPGIGPWTAQYIAMRAMAWPDAFLETDAGIKRALAPRTPKECLALAESWRPFRSYATMTLWNGLQETP